MSSSIQIALDCQYQNMECALSRFFSQSREAMFLTRKDGTILTTNTSFDRLLGYEEGELAGMDASILYDDATERLRYRRIIDNEGLVHDYGLALKKKNGEVLLSLVDAVVLKDQGEVIGYHGLVRTDRDMVSAFRKYFLDLKAEKEKLQAERRNIFSDSVMYMRYMSDDLIRYVRDTGQNPLETGRKNATILYFDLRKSTSLAEELEPEELADFFNGIFTDIMDLIYGNSGSVNRLTGDGILASFGCPIETEPGTAVQQAVDTARQISEYLNTYNDVRPSYLKEPIKAGIGLATGSVFSGVIGSVRRQEYTILGRPVNAAVALEKRTKSCDCPVLADRNTAESLQVAESFAIIGQADLGNGEEPVFCFKKD